MKWPYIYKISTIPEYAYYKALGAVSLMNYRNTAETILKEKVNLENIDLVLAEWDNFITSRSERKYVNETVKYISRKLMEIKSKRDIL